MTRREYIGIIGNTWKGNQLRALCRSTKYDFWRFHVGAIGSKTFAIRMTFAALHCGKDANRLGDVAARIEARR